MISITTGNLLESDAEALVNTVNIVGVMGKGIALQFKKAFPNNFELYAEACKRKMVRVGEMFVTHNPTLNGEKIIINFPTKRHWKGASRLEDIELGLKDLVRVVQENKIKSIAIPPLGCGLGGLPWDKVRARIETTFASVPHVDVKLYPPQGAPKAETMPNRTAKPKMTTGKAAFLGILVQYMDMLFSSDVTLLEVQKLSYFLQLAGEPLRLKFVKWHYGPYADNLRHVLNEMDNHYIQGWGDGMNKPLIPIKVLDTARSEIAPLQYEDTQKRLTRVLDLVEGFDSPYGLELLGTVHWVLSHELDRKTSSAEQVHKAICAWTDRKSKMFMLHHVDIAMTRLQEQYWV